MKTSVWIALAVLLFLFLAGAGAGIYLFNKKHKDLLKTKPDFTLSASELQKEFGNNEQAATAKYVNRILEVSGVIASVNLNDDKTISITLVTESDLNSVICTFPSVSDSTLLKKGLTVTLRGECSGYLTDVLLNNCSVIHK